MTDQELVELVAAGERPGVEFKGPRPRTDRHQFAEVARAALGMVNRRDGGLVLIGVDNAATIVGLTTADADTWRTADDVRATLAPFADPFIYVDIEVKTLAIPGPAQGRLVAILRVHEFETTPVLCARQAADRHGNELLRNGGCYVRTPHMPATSEIADHAQMRELLDLAIEKGVREFLRRARAAGLEPGAGHFVTDLERFREQRERAFDE